MDGTARWGALLALTLGLVVSAGVVLAEEAPTPEKARTSDVQVDASAAGEVEDPAGKVEAEPGEALDTSGDAEGQAAGGGDEPKDADAEGETKGAGGGDEAKGTSEGDGPKDTSGGDEPKDADGDDETKGTSEGDGGEGEDATDGEKVMRPPMKKPEELPRSDRRTSGTAFVMDITGVINPISEEYFMRAVDKAEEESANFLLIEMDTPGGLVESTRVMIKRMLSSKVPIVVYVTPQGSRAASAGTFLTMASHVAAMAPNTNIGSAHPVGIGGGGGGGKDEDEDAKKRAKEQEAILLEKMANDLAAWLGGIAETRGRNADWARDAILKSANIDCRTALETNVIEYIALDRQELMEKMHGRAVKMGDGTHEIVESKGVRVTPISMTSREKVLHTVSDPNIAYMLMMLGMMGIMFEVTHPGMIVPGMVGVIALALAFMGLRVLPVSSAGLLLLLLAAAMFLLELSFATGGILSVGAITAFAAGSYMLIEVPSLKISLSLIFAMTGAMTFMLVFVLGYLVKSLRYEPKVAPGPLVGQTGKAREAFTDEGYIRIGGEYWKCTLVNGGSLDEGAEVRVLKQAGTRLEVEPVDQESVAH